MGQSVLEPCSTVARAPPALARRSPSTPSTRPAPRRTSPAPAHRGQPGILADRDDPISPELSGHRGAIPRRLRSPAAGKRWRRTSSTLMVLPTLMVLRQNPIILRRRRESAVWAIDTACAEFVPGFPLSSGTAGSGAVSCRRSHQMGTLREARTRLGIPPASAPSAAGHRDPSVPPVGSLSEKGETASR